MAKCHFRLLEAGEWQKKLCSSQNKKFSGTRNKIFCVLCSPKKFFEKTFLILKCHFWLLATENSKTNYFQVQTEDFRVHRIRFFAFFSLQRPKRTPLYKTQKNLIFFKRISLYSMSKDHFWPLEAGKRKKKGFLSPQNKVFRILWPPEAKNDPSS